MNKFANKIDKKLDWLDKIDKLLPVVIIPERKKASPK